MTRACPDCGRTWDQEGQWCGVCGAALPRAPAPPRRRPTGDHDALADGPRDHRTVLGGLAAALAMALAVVLVLAVSREEAVPSASGDLDGEVAVPSMAPPDDATPGDAGGTDVPMELLATCDGPEGPEGCVRWVQRTGLPARPGTRPLVSVLGDRLLALDPETGTRRWSAPVRTPASAPAGVGDHTVVVDDALGVRALDADDGDERWRQPGLHLPPGGPEPLEQPVVLLDDLAGTLTAVDVASGDVRWTRALALPAEHPVTVLPLSPDRVAVAAAESLWVLQLALGRIVWTAGARGQEPETPVAITNLHVVTLRPGGDATAPPRVRVRTAAGRVLADVPLPGGARVRELAITDARLVLRTVDEVLGMDLDTGEVAWRRPDVEGRLAAAQAAPLVPSRWMVGRAGVGTIATRSWNVVVLETDGTVTVLDPRTGQDARSYGEPAEGVRVGGGFVTQRRLWRVDADSLEVVDIPSLEQVLRIEVRAPPTVVSTDPVIIATSGRLVRLDATSAPTGEAPATR